MFILKGFLIFLSVCFFIQCQTLQVSDHYKREPQSEEISIEKLAESLEKELQPYVKKLDRDLWTFRYESGDDRFEPNSNYDLQNRIVKWAERFYDSSILSGADTGPGVYVATEPVATATWGGKNPRLFAIKLKSGTSMLMGDQYKTPKNSVLELSKISQLYKCDIDTRSFEWDIGHIFGNFRMSPNIICRSGLIRAARRLKIQALSYGFDSVPLESCRTTGTAISIINSASIALEEINWYSPSIKIEGQPMISPFVKTLFKEAQIDFHAQSKLADRNTLKSFQRGFGFFDSVQEIDQKSYHQWKNQHILKCGEQWSIEDINPLWKFKQNYRSSLDNEIKNYLIGLSVTYRERAHSDSNSPQEFNVKFLRAIIKNEFAVSLLPQSSFALWLKMRSGELIDDRSIMDENTMANQLTEIIEMFNKSAKYIYDKDAISKLMLQKSYISHNTRNYFNSLFYLNANAPIWSASKERIKEDRHKYIDILRKCLSLYSDMNISFNEISKSDCGITNN